LSLPHVPSFRSVVTHFAAAAHDLVVKNREPSTTLDPPPVVPQDPNQLEVPSAVESEAASLTDVESEMLWLP
jgi:hypothetical protein